MIHVRALHHRAAALHIEIIDFRAAGGVKRAVFERVQYRGDIVLGVHAHPAQAVLAHRVAVIGRHAVDHLALREQLVPVVAVVHVHAVLDRAAAVPQLHGEVALEHLVFAHGRAAPLGMAVDGQVVCGVQLVQQRLRVLGFAQAQALEALILLEAVALRLFRADADDMVAVDVRPARAGHIAVHLHAGDDGQRRVAVIGEVIIAVIGQRDEIIAVLGVLLQHLLGRSPAVRAGGVAVKGALQQLPGVDKGSLTFHDKIPSSNNRLMPDGSLCNAPPRKPLQGQSRRSFRYRRGL